MFPILEDCKTVTVFTDHVSQVQGLLFRWKTSICNGGIRSPVWDHSNDLRNYGQ